MQGYDNEKKTYRMFERRNHTVIIVRFCPFAEFMKKNKYNIGKYFTETEDQ